MRSIARWLAQGVPTGLPLPVLRGPLRGRWWLAGAGAGSGKGLGLLFRATEEREMRALARLAPRGGVAFDLGANVGMYSLLLARSCARVFAFEPMPRNLHFLVRTLASNGADNVTVVPCAVSDHLGLDAISEGASCAEAALDPCGTQPTLTVSCDQFAERFGVEPALLKVDVEGAEAAVLRGASRILRTHPVVLLSTHGPAAEAECRELMRAAGYRDEPERLAIDAANGGSTLLWAGAARAPASPSAAAGSASVG